MDTTFLSPKRIHIIRIEQRDTHIGPIKHSSVLHDNGMEDEYTELILHDGMDPIVSFDKDPNQWNNPFGDMWRANIKRRGSHYNKNIAPWRFGFDARQSKKFIRGVASLIQRPVRGTDFVIATYTCPAHTWFRNKDGRVAFLYDQATRDAHIIDRSNINTYLT